MHIRSCLSGKAVFVDAECLNSWTPLKSLFSASCKALLEDAEPSEYHVIDEEMFYMPSGLEDALYRADMREEYLPEQEGENVHLCHAAWCGSCGVLLARRSGRAVAAYLPAITREQVQFLRGCAEDLRKMAAQADEILPKELSPAEALLKAAAEIDIDQTVKILS